MPRICPHRIAQHTGWVPRVRTADPCNTLASCRFFYAVPARERCAHGGETVNGCCVQRQRTVRTGSGDEGWYDHPATAPLNRGMDMFDDNQEALLTARDHQTILAALRFWRTMVLSPDTPSPERVLAEVIPIAAAAGTPLSLAEAEALIRRMERLRVGTAQTTN
jgi:hypothetical protein